MQTCHIYRQEVIELWSLSICLQDSCNCTTCAPQAHSGGLLPPVVSERDCHVLFSVSSLICHLLFVFFFVSFNCE